MAEKENKQDGDESRRWLEGNAAAECARLEQLANRQRQLFETVPVGIAILEGPEHRYLLINPAYRPFVTDKGEVVGRTVAEVFPEIADAVIPLLDHVYYDGKPYTAVDMPLSIQRDGQREECFISFSYLPWHEETGQIAGVMVLAIDSTEQVHIRQQIEQERARLNTVLETLPVGVIILDTQNRIVATNGHAEPIYSGIEPMAHPLHYYLRGKAWWSATGEPVSGDAWPSRQAITHGIVMGGDIDIRRDDGTLATVYDLAAPLRNEQGQITGAVVVIQDITERKRAVEEEKRSKAQLEAVFQSIQDGIVVADMSGNFVLVNQAEARINGYPSTEAMRKDLVYFGGVYELCLPDGQPLPFEQWPLARILRGETLDNVELRARRKDTGQSWYFSFSGSPVRNTEGQQILGVVITRNVTETKHAEEELRRLTATLEQRVGERTEQLSRALEREQSARIEAESARAYFSGLLEAAPDSIVIVDADGKIVLVNGQTEQVSGYRREELIGKPVETLIPERYHAAHRGHRAGFMADPRTRPMGVGLDLFLRRKDGGEMPVEISLSPFQTQHGMLVTASIRDITARKQAEAEIKRLNEDLQLHVEQLKAANAELEAFSYSVSHDLRAPLRSIDGFSKILIEKYPQVLDERGQDYLARVRAAAQRMGRLIDDMLNLSRVGRLEMHFEPIDVSALAAEIITELREQEPTRQVDVEIMPGMTAIGDAALLQIALKNLLGNAWKFTSKREQARIEMGMQEVNGECEFYIRDNGAGFSTAYTEKLFTPFQRLHTEAEFPGTGIGLALVRRIINRHGGHIRAEGEEEHGATFYFSLGEATP